MSPALHALATSAVLLLAACAAVVHLRRMVQPRCHGCGDAPAAPASARRGVRPDGLKILGQRRG